MDTRQSPFGSNLGELFNDPSVTLWRQVGCMNDPSDANGQWDVTLVEKVSWCWTRQELLRNLELRTKDESVEILGFGCYTL